MNEEKLKELVGLFRELSGEIIVSGEVLAQRIGGRTAVLQDAQWRLAQSLVSALADRGLISFEQSDPDPNSGGEVRLRATITVATDLTRARELLAELLTRATPEIEID